MALFKKVNSLQSTRTIATLSLSLTICRCVYIQILYEIADVNEIYIQHTCRYICSALSKDNTRYRFFLIAFLVEIVFSCFFFINSHLCFEPLYTPLFGRTYKQANLFVASQKILFVFFLFENNFLYLEIYLYIYI